jgi:hypothetical protein
MKKMMLFGLLGATALIMSGCTTGRHVSTVRELGVIDTLPETAPKGYVEFYTRSANGPVPIYLVDEQNNSHLLAAVGLDAGNKYHAREGMKVSERLRVAAPAGTHLFALQKDGPQIQVPVKENQVTCVEVNYKPIDNAEQYVVYQMDYAVKDPVRSSEAVGSAPRSE